MFLSVRIRFGSLEKVKVYQHGDYAAMYELSRRL